MLREIYTCVCVYMCIYIYIYVYICICIYTYIYIYREFGACIPTAMLHNIAESVAIRDGVCSDGV